MTETHGVVYIRNLTFDAIIGVLPEERIHPQPVCINLEVTLETQPAAVSTELTDTLDYAALAAAVQSLSVEAQCLLVETLAENIAALALDQANVQRVVVDVMKPNAVANAEGVGVRIQRSKP